MEKIQLPENVMKELKCNLCGEFLSYAPITLHAVTGSVCGRCPPLEAERDIDPLRESNYEKIAKHLLLFPCRYHLQGCEGIFSMDDIPIHEEACSHRPFFCPVMPLGCCAWQGSPAESHMHFMTDHQDFLLQTNVFELDIINRYATNMLMSQFDCLFLVHKEYNSSDGTFYCGIYQITNYEIKNYDYVLGFKSGDGQRKFQVGAKPVPRFKNDISKQDGFKINGPVIRDSLSSPMIITCTLQLTEKVHVNELPVEELQNLDLKAEAINTSDDEAEIIKLEDDKMLLDIECPVCQEFMIPPIYQCQVGHSVCGICKPQLRECPSCRGPLGKTLLLGHWDL